jgi:aminomethyltransferase
VAVQNLFNFQNGQGDLFGRSFPGMHSPHASLSWGLDPRQAQVFDLQSGDLLSLYNLSHVEQISLVAFDEEGNDALSRLNLKGDDSLDLTSFNVEQFAGWHEANGGNLADSIKCKKVSTNEDTLILKVKAKCTVWIILPHTVDSFIEGGVSGAISISLQHAEPSNLLLPPPLGKIRDEFTISRATAQTYELKKGEVVQIIDVQGQQCSDFMAFRTDGLMKGFEQRIDSTVTRAMVRGAYPTPGMFDKFFDSEMRPLLNIVQDTVGRHDTFGLACTGRGYEERGFPGHVNCSDNISDAVESYGVKRRNAWPAINFFFNAWIDREDNHFQSEESWSRAGDYIALKAMDDLLCVSTACPDDIDPINGWNPTDIHIRVYKSDAPIERSIGYREKENAILSISEESAFQRCTEKLTQQFAPARDLWAPICYPSLGTLGEYWACRKNVTLQDMSGLRKYDIVGPDAEKLLQKAMTRDVAKLAVWRGSYLLICDEQGTVIDDGTLFRLGPQLFRWCCGTEESARVLTELAESDGLQVRVNAMRSALPNLALQGPRSREVLKKLIFTQPHVPSLDDLKWFGVTIARLKDRDGMPFMLSRSGYTGELGYELFCDKSHATELWDALMEAGEEFDIAPMGTAALETIRIEAGLAASGAEFANDVDAFEAGLGFAVDLRKADFVGKAALERNSENPRRVLKGFILDCDDVPSHGAHIYLNERPVGVVTSATRSPTLETAIAIGRVAIEHAENGTVLEIGQMGGHMKRLKATVTDIPFVDPQRKRARA